MSGTSCPGENAGTRELAITLYRSGKKTYGPHRWQEFLTLAANLFRINNRWLPKAPIPLFYAAVDALTQSQASADVHGDGSAALHARRRRSDASSTSSES